LNRALAGGQSPFRGLWRPNASLVARQCKRRRNARPKAPWTHQLVRPGHAPSTHSFEHFCRGLVALARRLFVPAGSDAFVARPRKYAGVRPTLPQGCGWQQDEIAGFAVNLT
jgi:hypothetical protein